MPFNVKMLDTSPFLVEINDPGPAFALRLDWFLDRLGTRSTRIAVGLRVVFESVLKDTAASGDGVIDYVFHSGGVAVFRFPALNVTKARQRALDVAESVGRRIFGDGGFLSNIPNDELVIHSTEGADEVRLAIRNDLASAGIDDWRPLGEFAECSADVAAVHPGENHNRSVSAETHEAGDAWAVSGEVERSDLLRDDSSSKRSRFREAGLDMAGRRSMLEEVAASYHAFAKVVPNRKHARRD